MCNARQSNYSTNTNTYLILQINRLPALHAWTPNNDHHFCNIAILDIVGVYVGWSCAHCPFFSDIVKFCAGWKNILEAPFLTFLGIVGFLLYIFVASGFLSAGNIYFLFGLNY